MIHSMTGFGRTQYSFESKHITLELKSLNSKSLDVNVRVPSSYKSKEIEIRKHISKTVLRGKVEFSIFVESLDQNKQYSINTNVVNAYLNELKTIDFNTSKEDLLPIAMRLPEVLSNKETEISDLEWAAFLTAYNKGFNAFLDFRKEEGQSLYNEFKAQILEIKKLAEKIHPFLPERIENVKNKISNSLKDISAEYDEQRFHQEMVYYLEKLDVTEEIVRLNQHLEYFLQTIDNETSSKGKKLAFISQEIGREINTLGSKANHSEIQKIVVMMKDCLEKIKEQTYNVL